MISEKINEDVLRLMRSRGVKDSEIQRYADVYSSNNVLACLSFSVDMDVVVKNGVVVEKHLIGIDKKVKYDYYNEFRKNDRDRFNQWKEGHQDNELQAHFLGYFKRKIRERIESGDYVPINKDHLRGDVKTVYCTDFVRSMSGKTVYAVDIKHCYWRTGVLIGAISSEINEKAYSIVSGKTTKEKREFTNKFTRNVAIGTLGSRDKKYSIRGGKVVGVEDYVEPLNVVRLDIIDRVWELATLINDNFKGVGMFLTDCWFVDKSNALKIMSYLHELGYESTIKPIDVRSVFKNHDLCLVDWYDESKRLDYEKLERSRKYSSLSFSRSNFI